MVAHFVLFKSLLTNRIYILLLKIVRCCRARRLRARPPRLNVKNVEAIKKGVKMTKTGDKSPEKKSSSQKSSKGSLYDKITPLEAIAMGGKATVIEVNPNASDSTPTDDKDDKSENE